MKISIIGASGCIGQEIVRQILASRLLKEYDTLQLVESNPESAHPYLLEGMVEDLLDAYEEVAPRLEVASDMDKMNGEIVLVAAGLATPSDPNLATPHLRDALAKSNLIIFERVSQQLRQYPVDRAPLALIITNPVELGIHVISRHMPRERVLGVGAHLDSLRFSREIARDLGIHRDRVKALVLGEHGEGLVPLWSTVTVDDRPLKEQEGFSEVLERAIPVKEFPETLALEVKTVVKFMVEKGQEGMRQALAHIARLSPDLRAALTPVGTQFSGAKTPVGTATSVVAILKAMLSKEPTIIATQYLCEGENGLYGPTGVRVMLTEQVQKVIPNKDLTKEEQERLKEVSASTKQKVEEWASSVADLDADKNKGEAGE